MKLQELHRQLMDEVNEMDCITLTIGKKQYPAKIAGAKLDFPFIYAIDENGRSIDCEINWNQVQKMKDGIIHTITY